MKTSHAILTAVSLAAFSVLTWAGAQTLTPANPVPTGALPPEATSVSGSIGITVYENVVYLVREGAVTRIDAATIPPGHMMTLDGRLTPLPPGVKLPGPGLPGTLDPRPEPSPRTR